MKVENIEINIVEKIEDESIGKYESNITYVYIESEVEAPKTWIVD
jgi:hypothetical protein